MTPLNDTHGLSIQLLHVLMLIHKPRSVISARNYNNTRYLQYDYTKYRTRLIVIINVKYNVVLYYVDQEKYEINIILFWNDLKGELSSMKWKVYLAQNGDLNRYKTKSTIFMSAITFLCNEANTSQSTLLLLYYIVCGGGWL